MSNQSTDGPIPTMPRDMSEGGAPAMDPRQVMATRELFWQNVMREILTSLSMACALRPSQPSARALAEAGGSTGGGDHANAVSREGAKAAPLAQAGAGEDAGGDARSAAESENGGRAPDDNLFDGRLAVLTRRGDRIAIADVFPLFACGIDTPRDRVLSIALECTVFQIRTPAGEVYTLPLHELATFQALSPELMRRLAQMARGGEEASGSQQPFGFAAFTSISRETPPPLADGEEFHSARDGEEGPRTGGPGTSGKEERP